MVKLIDPEGDRKDLVSQRNVWVEERPPCGLTQVYTFTIYNDSSSTVTVDIGLITFDVPEDWTVTTVPTGTQQIGLFSELVVEVHVLIPCPSTLQAISAAQEIRTLQEKAGGVPTIDVEGYIDGKLVGGIEIQFPEEEAPNTIYLPVVMKNYP